MQFGYSICSNGNQLHRQFCYKILSFLKISDYHFAQIFLEIINVNSNAVIKKTLVQEAICLLNKQFRTWYYYLLHPLPHLYRIGSTALFRRAFIILYSGITISFQIKRLFFKLTFESAFSNPKRLYQYQNHFSFF